jgi:hypothetical protein
MKHTKVKEKFMKLKGKNYPRRENSYSNFNLKLSTVVTSNPK